MYQDITLTCRDCGNEFTFTAGEQEFYAIKGFNNQPLRCKECRVAKKSLSKTEREFFTGICCSCGKEARVPFNPSSGRPIYCSVCYEARRKPQ